MLPGFAAASRSTTGRPDFARKLPPTGEITVEPVQTLHMPLPDHSDFHQERKNWQYRQNVLLLVK
jgi:hypothetical protein